MLGYARELPAAAGPQRFAGTLIFKSARSSGLVLDGPEDGRIDLVTVEVAGDQTNAIEALGRAVSAWQLQST